MIHTDTALLYAAAGNKFIHEFSFFFPFERYGGSEKCSECIRTVTKPFMTDNLLELVCKSNRTNMSYFILKFRILRLKDMDLA